MNISYASRSKFMTSCVKSIIAQQEILNEGQIINITLEPGGYLGNTVITILPTNSIEFETDWVTTDSTRFPVRIKAAATALRDCDNTGRFAISHADGVLSIKKQA